ncbi:hypothetical protein BgiBS90_003708, partial [Biomphalaria glabrata]
MVMAILYLWLIFSTFSNRGMLNVIFLFYLQAKTRTILANVFYNMLQSKLESELTQPEPQDFEIPYESSKRSKSSKWAGS